MYQVEIFIEGALDAFSIGIYKDYKKQINPIENNITEANLELNSLKDELEKGSKYVTDYAGGVKVVQF